MGDVFVGSLMSTPVHTVDGGTPLRETARLLTEHDVGSVVVVDEGGRLDGAGAEPTPPGLVGSHTRPPGATQSRDDWPPRPSGRTLVRSATRATLPPQAAVRTRAARIRETA